MECYVCRIFMKGSVVAIIVSLNVFDAVGSWFQGIADAFYGTFIENSRYLLFLQGLGVTLLLAVVATLIGVVVGIMVAIVRVYSCLLYTSRCV